jgi:gamma-glutamylcyclotransferase (GGCT)/AIG2-like uncharacterized protein YtfP
MSQFLKTHSKVLGKGFINGKLYDVGAYPAAVLSNLKNDKIYGTILKMTDAENTFKVLDAYEGLEDSPPLYLRKSVPVHLENQRFINAWVYIYNSSINHLKPIPSGDYLNP